MLTEEELIPYHASNLTGKRVLVLAPHPDDETIGCGGSIALHGAAGDPVKIVVLTDGGMGDMSNQTAKDDYVGLRKKEALDACAILGIFDLEFWGYPDRALSGSRGALRKMMDLLVSFAPDLVYCPSPLEIHPDHRATSFLLFDAIRSCDVNFDVAFYEINQPVSVRSLVDITSVIDKKKGALKAYESQLKELPYDDVCLALSRFRSVTLPGGATHAEGYCIYKAESLRKMSLYGLPFQRVGRLTADSGKTGPLVSVIVRTKDRPGLLVHALNSIQEQTYSNLEIVVVNDGGMDVRDVIEAVVQDIPVTYISHESCKGRSEAANSGMGAARGAYFNFLDDDDVLLYDHVETLASYLTATGEKVAYGNAINVYFIGSPEIPGERTREELVYNLDFDSDHLLFENYIPVMSVLFSREVLAEEEGFCKDLDRFEDWDFWIRVSRSFPFKHIDKVTAEYRFYGVFSMERPHRQKILYEEAKAKIFDRTRPLLSGRAWVNFQNSGWLKELQERIQEKSRRLTEPEEEFNCSGEALARERLMVADLRKENGRLLMENNTLNARYDENQRFLERMQLGYTYRFFEKSREFFKRFLGSKGA